MEVLSYRKIKVDSSDNIKKVSVHDGMVTILFVSNDSIEISEKKLKEVFEDLGYKKMGFSKPEDK